MQIVISIQAMCRWAWYKTCARTYVIVSSQVDWLCQFSHSDKTEYYKRGHFWDYVRTNLWFVHAYSAVVLESYQLRSDAQST